METLRVSVSENGRFSGHLSTYLLTLSNCVNRVSFSRHANQRTVKPLMSPNTKTISGRTVGYARVSTSEQDIRLQIDALRKHGVPKSLLFTDKASGAKRDRCGLEACLTELREGDVLLVWRLDRLGRSVRHLVSLIEELQTSGVGFRSICDGAIDTTSASGELVFHVFSALAQFERRLISERTKAGLAAARARGRLGGRPKLDPRDPRIATARTLHRDQSLSIAEICSTLRCSRSTLYRWLKASAEM